MRILKVKHIFKLIKLNIKKISVIQVLQERKKQNKKEIIYN